jgi:biopolymer transport protein ExbB
MMSWLEALFDEFASLFGEGRGDVCLIFLLAAIFWALVIERYWYFYLLYPRMRDEAMRRWRYSVRNPVHGRRSRRRILREMASKNSRGITFIDDLIQVILLLGSLGLVGGLIRILDAMASSAGIDIAALLGGISAAGVVMAAALAVVITGVYFSRALHARAVLETRLLGDRLRHD